jgi:hypothetical protein
MVAKIVTPGETNALRISAAINDHAGLIDTAENDIQALEIEVAALQALNSREVLTANRTYFVRTDGSDSNDGLANTAGGAFLTIQKAVDVATMLDLSIYSITISVADGTYTGNIALKTIVGAGTITIQGNTATPANVIISVTSAHCIQGNAVLGFWRLSGMKLVANSAGFSCIFVSQGTKLAIVSGFEFGAAGAGGHHILAQLGALVSCTTNYTISGAAATHWNFQTGSIIQYVNRTVTVSGTPAFSTAFASASHGAGLLVTGLTFSGAATGTRYSVTINAWIDTNGGGATYFPGNAGGAAATGGQYV